MKKLVFERRKYGKELLMDACDETELEIVADTLVLSFYAIIVLEKCEGIYHLDTETIELQDGMVLFVKPGQVSEVSKAVFGKGYFLFFEGDFLDEFFNDQDFIFKFGYFHNPHLPSYIILDPNSFEKYKNIAGEILEEIRNLTADSRHILRSLIYYLMVRLNQQYGIQYGSSNKTLGEPIILKFIKLIQSGIKEKLRVEEVARTLNISRVHLNSLCKKHFSKTANQLIQEQLIAEIKKEIKYSNKDFSEIAYDFHFSAPSHFSRFVKKMTGLSPQSIREELSKW